MVCFRYISVNTLHKVYGDDDDDDISYTRLGSSVNALPTFKRYFDKVTSDG